MFIRAGVWILVVLVGSICFVEFIVKLGEKCLEENACCSKNMYLKRLYLLFYNTINQNCRQRFLCSSYGRHCTILITIYGVPRTSYKVWLYRSILFNGACLKVICYHVDWNQKELGHTFPMFWKSLGLFCCGPRGTVVDEKYMIGETTEKTSLFSPPSLPHKAGFRP